jgi:N-acetyl-1-D-myo-inositol-2-amino-2-deoxy-alpha-D-glucopyranoside deacetylase
MAKATFQPQRLLIVHAHPDDESLFTGHVIADRISAKAEVMVFTLTRGERGKVKLEELKPLEGNLAAMGAFRSGELREALAAFGPVKHAFAGTRAYLDSGMRINSFGKPAKPRKLDELALSAASTAVIADDIFKAIKEFKPDAVLTYNRKGGFGHPDHKIAHEATAMAIRMIAKRRKGRAPAFWVVSEPGESFDVEIGGSKTAATKKEALSAHVSQVSVSAETYSISAGEEIRYDRPERLRRASPNPLVHLRPLLTFFWAIPLGFLLGVAGTLLHQVRASDSSATPIGLIVALVMTGSLAIAIRLLRSSRGALYLLAATFAATVFWLAQPQADGTLLIPGDELGNIWAYGSLGLVAIIILFPNIRAGSWRKSARGHQ